MAGIYQKAVHFQDARAGPVQNPSPQDYQSTHPIRLGSIALLYSDAGDPLRGRGIDALHRHIYAVLAQYQGCCLPIRLGDEADAFILVGEFGIAPGKDRHWRLAGELRIQLLAVASNRQHGIVVQLVESDVAIAYSGIRGALLRCGLDRLTVIRRVDFGGADGKCDPQAGECQRRRVGMLCLFPQHVPDPLLEQ